MEQRDTRHPEDLGHSPSETELGERLRQIHNGLGRDGLPDKGHTNPELDPDPRDLAYRRACRILDQRIEELDALTVTWHRERLVYHAHRLRELGASP